MNTPKSTRGGKREGAGRKPQGKKHYDVTLTEERVIKAREIESNLSGLLDSLLAKWLARQS